MKILVTGWDGYSRAFIPRAVAQYMISKGHDVHILGYQSDYKVYFSPKFYDESSNRWHFLETPNISYYDLIIHLGGMTENPNISAEEYMDKNFDYTFWIVDTAIKARIPIHYASSAAIYGNNKNFSEYAPKDPTTHYSWSKYLIDRTLSKLMRDFETPVIGFRYFSVYGVGQEDHKLNYSNPISHFFKEATDVGVITLPEGYEHIKKDFVCIKDICEIHEKMLNYNKSGIFNVGTGTPVSLKYIAEKYQDKFLCDIDSAKFDERHPWLTQKYTCSDNTRLNSVIDHKFTTVDEYLASIYKA